MEKKRKLTMEEEVVGDGGGMSRSGGGGSSWELDEDEKEAVDGKRQLINQHIAFGRTLPVSHF